MNKYYKNNNKILFSIRHETGNVRLTSLGYQLELILQKYYFKNSEISKQNCVILTENKKLNKDR